MVSVNRIKELSYKLIANVHMWYIFIFSKQDVERAKHIYARWAEMQMSALYIFVVSVPVVMTISIIFENPLLPFLILVFGGNLALTLIILSREKVFYWEWKRRKDEEELKAREAARQKQREQEREQLKSSAERMRSFFEAKQRVNQQQNTTKQYDQEYKEISYHLGNLELPANCRNVVLIKRTYRNLMKKYHPDINKDVHSAEIMKLVVGSYKFLEKKLNV